MGMIQCREHGRAGIALVCPHVAESLENGNRIEWLDVRIDEMFLPNVPLCFDCHEKWVASASPSDRELIIDALQPVCGKCFKGNESKGGNLTL